jgi:hypothetical protein
VSAMERRRGAGGAPVRRRVVGAYVLVALAVIGLLVALSHGLRHDLEDIGSTAPGLTADVDPLRDESPCLGVVAREGSPSLAPPPGSNPVVTRSSGELLTCPVTYDGSTVRFIGEVVGAVLDRGDHAWVQLNDDIYADERGPLPTHRDFQGMNSGLGARLEADQADLVSVIGGPRTQGDLVEVVGVFHRVHPRDGEVAVLDVMSMRVLRQGAPTVPPEVPARMPVALIAAAVALGAVVVERQRRDT